MNRPFQKLLIALLIAILLIFGVSGPLLRNSGDSRLAESELARGYAKIDHIAAALSDQDSRYESFSEHFVENLHRSVGMRAFERLRHGKRIYRSDGFRAGHDRPL